MNLNDLIPSPRQRKFLEFLEIVLTLRRKRLDKTSTTKSKAKTTKETKKLSSVIPAQQLDLLISMIRKKLGK